MDNYEFKINYFKNCKKLRLTTIVFVPPSAGLSWYLSKVFPKPF